MSLDIFESYKDRVLQDTRSTPRSPTYKTPLPPPYNSRIHVETPFVYFPASQSVGELVNVYVIRNSYMSIGIPENFSLWERGETL